MPAPKAAGQKWGQLCTLDIAENSAWEALREKRRNSVYTLFCSLRPRKTSASILVSCDHDAAGILTKTSTAKLSVSEPMCQVYRVQS